MLRQIITYSDYNDNPQTEEVYFNLTRTEMTDMFELQPRLEAWSKSTQGDARDLSVPEIREMLDIVKDLIKRSYGVRSADGKHFRKGEEVYRDFEESAAYDAFVFGLFEQPEKALEFMVGILPKQLQSEVQANVTQEVQLPSAVEMTAVDKEVPAYIRENRDPTQAELRDMSPEELRNAFKARVSK